MVGEMNNFRTGTQLRARTSRVPSSRSTDARTHARTRQHEGAHRRRRAVARPRNPSPSSAPLPRQNPSPRGPRVCSSWTIHNLGIIYISLRAIISGPGRAHRVSDKFEPRAEATARGDAARRRRSRERYGWTRILVDGPRRRVTRSWDIS